MEWINRVAAFSQGHTVLIKWHGQEIQGADLLELLS